jgi:hypothetical protein
MLKNFFVPSLNLDQLFSHKKDMLKTAARLIRQHARTVVVRRFADGPPAAPAAEAASAVQERIKLANAKLDEAVNTPQVKAMAAGFKPTLFMRLQRATDLALLRYFHTKWEEFDQDDFLEGASSAFQYFCSHLAVRYIPFDVLGLSRVV